VLAVPLDIRCFEAGRVVLAAGSTLQAVYLFESLLMQVGQLLQYLILVRTLQELPEAFLLLLAFLLPVMQHVGRHFAKVGKQPFNQKSFMVNYSKRKASVEALLL
jgi:hypothetical protein